MTKIKSKGKRQIRRGLLRLICCVMFLFGMLSSGVLAAFSPAAEGQALGFQQGADWRLTLVNPWQEIPADYSPELVQLRNGQAVDKRCYPDLQRMLDDCRDAGLEPLVVSSYRTQEKQQQLFDRKVDYYLALGYEQEAARQQAATIVARPGASEHQLGLAVDIDNMDALGLDETKNDEVWQWLAANSWRYGFILRYPADKTEITGIIYEPWHFRYVGAEAAQAIYESGLCLEEYLQDLAGGAITGLILPCPKSPPWGAFCCLAVDLALGLCYNINRQRVYSLKEVITMLSYERKNYAQTAKPAAGAENSLPVYKRLVVLLIFLYVPIFWLTYGLWWEDGSYLLGRVIKPFYYYLPEKSSVLLFFMWLSVWPLLISAYLIKKPRLSWGLFALGGVIFLFLLVFDISEASYCKYLIAQYEPANVQPVMLEAEPEQLLALPQQEEEFVLYLGLSQTYAKQKFDLDVLLNHCDAKVYYYDCRVMDAERSPAEQALLEAYQVNGLPALVVWRAGQVQARYFGNSLTDYFLSPGRFVYHKEAVGRV